MSREQSLLRLQSQLDNMPTPLLKHGLLSRVRREDPELFFSAIGADLVNLYASNAFYLTPVPLLSTPLLSARPAKSTRRSTLDPRDSTSPSTTRTSFVKFFQNTLPLSRPSLISLSLLTDLVFLVLEILVWAAWVSRSESSTSTLPVVVWTLMDVSPSCLSEYPCGMLV